nr:collagen alpha-1(I) chain-like [Ovis aries]
MKMEVPKTNEWEHLFIRGSDMHVSPDTRPAPRLSRRRPAGRADPAPGARAEPEGGGGCAGAPAPACPQRAGASSPAGSGWERREPGRTGPSPHGRPEQPRGGRGRAGPASREPASGGPGLAAALGSRRGAKGAAAKLTTLAALSPEKQRLKQSPSPAALPGCDSGNRNGDAARKARGSSQPGDRTQVSRTAGDSSPAEPPGEPLVGNREAGKADRTDLSCSLAAVGAGASILPGPSGDRTQRPFQLARMQHWVDLRQLLRPWGRKPLRRNADDARAGSPRTELAVGARAGMKRGPQELEAGFTPINSLSIAGFLFIFTFKKQSDICQLSIWRRKWQATHSSILAWRNPWTEEPGGLQSVGSQESGTT